MSLAERVVVMEHGRIMQKGTPSEIYANPQQVCGRVHRTLELVLRYSSFGGPPGVHRFDCGGNLEMLVPKPAHEGAPRYEVCVRPERIAVHRDKLDEALVDGQPINVLQGQVSDIAYLGPDLHLLIDVEGRTSLSVIEKNIGQPVEHQGERVRLNFRPHDCIIVPAE